MRSGTLRGRRTGLGRVLAVAVAACTGAALWHSSAGATPRISTRIGPSVIHVGDSVQVEVRLDPGEGVETPRWPETIGPFELISATRVDSGGVAILRAVLTTFEIGSATVPPLAIPVRGAGGIDTVRSGSWLVSVVSLLPADSVAADTAAFRPAAAPLDLVGRFQWGALVLYLALLGAIGGLVWWFWAHKPARRLLPVLVPAAPVRPPELVAFEALDAVAARAYPERGLFKPYYTEVVDVLRSYVEGRYAIEALDRTAAELSEALRAGGVAEGFRRRLDRLQEEADLVKFARVTPDVDSAIRLMAAARDWVRDTTAAAAAAPPPATLTVPPTPPVPPAPPTAPTAPPSVPPVPPTESRAAGGAR